MSCYISSNENRFYVSSETAYGQAPAVAAINRFPAVRLDARQACERLVRRDKTGGRSFAGFPAGTRRATSFELKTYMTSWANQAAPPAYGPLFAAVMGQPALLFTGRNVSSMPSATRVQFVSAHGLLAGQAITFGGEIRFVTSIVDAQTVNFNAPFSLQPGAGAMLGPSVTYKLGKELPSVSLFDFWQEGGVNRIVAGSAMDTLRLKVNADFHEFRFKGPASDVIDSASFAAGQGNLTSFPGEPALALTDFSVIPGHLGQVWLGATPSRFYTLTDAELTLDNDIDTRFHEFGAQALRCISPGRRSVKLDFELFADDEDATRELYQAARQQSPVSVMLQLGEQPGQLFGGYLQSVIPEVPAFDDSDRRLRWRFDDCRAQGTVDDELTVAFG